MIPYYIKNNSYSPIMALIYKILKLSGQFKYFVDQCHNRGIAVILDIIWNHIRSSSPLWQMQPDYDHNPYIKHHEQMNPNEAPESWGMLDMDHFNVHTIEYINKVHRIWVDEYKIDGFRFDAAAHLGWSVSQPRLRNTPSQVRCSIKPKTIYFIFINPYTMNFIYIFYRMHIKVIHI